MDRPDESVERLYRKHDIDGISVWINIDVNEKSVNELTIGYRKILFFGELTVSGIESKVFVQ